MSDNDNYLKILDKMSEIQVDVGVLTNEVGHVKSDLADTRAQLTKINEQDIEQNQLLDRHILGVKTAMDRLEVEKSIREKNHELTQKQIEELDSRMKKAEAFPNFFKDLKKILKWVAAVIVAVSTIVGLFKAL